MPNHTSHTVIGIGLVCLTGLAFAQLVTPPPVSPENPLTEEKRVLGKILFWDEQLSSDDTVACGTCHIPAAGGADPRFAAHPGPDGLFGTEDDTIGSAGIVHRNVSNEPVVDPVFGSGRQVTGRASPTILMSMYAEDVFWDGRARSTFTDPLNPIDILIPNGGALESQAVGPILSNVEMARDGRTWADVTNKLAVVTPLARAANIPPDMTAILIQNPSYPELFEAAFGDPTITPARIGMAIATYERTLVPDQTPWDLYMAGDTTAMTEDQIQGWIDFSEQTVCDNCHTLPHFTDHQFYNIGLRPADEDIGRQSVTQLGEDFGSFKTPTLRNVGLRKFQMHVGWITDAQDAVDFYNAESAVTRHTQFTANQSGIPTQNPGNFVDYSTLSFFVPSPARQAIVVDFLENALTDPRVAAEEFPFDRPALGSEMATIMTYNVQAPGWTPERADIVADIIRQQNADIVGLQEAGPNQQSDLLSRLSDVYDFENFAAGAAFEPILLKKDVFAILESGSNTVTPGCNSQGFVNYLVLEHLTSAERLIIHNNHFCATIINFPAGEPTAVERNEAHAVELVNTIFNNQAKWNAPAIALGDLNASINSDTMQFLLEQIALSGGAANPIVLNDAWDAAFPGVPYPARIDWILMTDIGFSVLDAKVISDAQTGQASDHEPVLTTLAIDTTGVGSVVVVDMESPTAPVNLLTTIVTDTTVTLSWNAASDNIGVTTYRVYRDGLLLATSSALTFNDSGLQAATSYLYSVTALDASGNESPSSEISVTTLAASVVVPPTASSGGGGGGMSAWLSLLLGMVCLIRAGLRRHRVRGWAFGLSARKLASVRTSGPCLPKARKRCLAVSLHAHQ